MAIRIEYADNRPIWMKIADHSEILMFAAILLAMLLVIVSMGILDRLHIIQLQVESPDKVYAPCIIATLLTLMGLAYVLIRILLAKLNMPENMINGFFDGRNIDIEIRSTKPVSIGPVTETPVAGDRITLHFEAREMIQPQEGSTRIRKTISDSAMGVLVGNKLFIFVKNVPDRAFYYQGKRVPISLATLVSGKPTEKEQKVAIRALLYAIVLLLCLALLPVIGFLLILIFGST